MFSPNNISLNSWKWFELNSLEAKNDEREDADDDEDDGGDDQGGDLLLSDVEQDLVGEVQALQNDPAVQDHKARLAVVVTYKNVENI